MAQKVLITGGSGLVGQHLSRLLIDKGYEIAWLSRKSGNKGNITIFEWDIAKRWIDENAFENVTYIIHLAGTGIADERWTDTRKKEIIDSRVESTKLLLEYVIKLDLKLEVFISSSATGFYGGDCGNDLKDEYSPYGNDFLSEVCQLWELGAIRFQEMGIRTVLIRTGIVLDDKNGALSKLAVPIKLGIGTYLGNGNQWMSWIHLEDICQIFIKSMEDKSFIGPYNAVAPNPVTNKVFSKILATQLKRWILPFYVPSFLFKILFGELSVVVTGSSHVLCRRLSETDFRFKFRTLEEALEDIYKSKQNS